MNRRTALVMMTSALAVAGCAPARTYRAELLDASARRAYTLATGDRLRIIVFGQDNLSNIYSVDANGRISMPLIGAVRVGGRTTGEVERTIEAGLKAGFIREPKVTVEIDLYRPFFILGEVTNSGQFPYVNGMNVQTAVAIAGGYTPRGAKQHAEITRQVGDALITATVPITYPVRPGDTIVIQERWF